uniref:Uncharacterized protein n=1 Tax=Hyaloperonospora arabidopsidis (strain Emoy2) TaxID=559515 RepID=M4BZ29_HYAAE
MTPTASKAVASSKGHTGSLHASNAEDEPALMVDYNESTPLPSPMDDEDSEYMWHGDGSVDPITDAQTAPVHNSCDVAVTSQSTSNKVVHVESDTISSKISKESAILDGPAASLSVNVSSERQDIHNGNSDFDKPEHKAPIRTLYLRPSVSQAHLFDGRYSSCSIPRMPPTTEWPVVYGSVASLLACADFDAHKYYGDFRTWKKEGRQLGRTFPIPCFSTKQPTNMKQRYSNLPSHTMKRQGNGPSE